MTQDTENSVKGRRAIYLLPNMITTLAFFSGFVSVVWSLDGAYSKAAVAIIIAGVLDALDGRIARLTKTTSLFGVEYDSLSDSFAFGAAPAVLMYTAILHPLGRFGWLGAFLFMVCGALRLARYNVQAQRVGEKHFTGLPIPAAAGMVAATVINGPRRVHCWCLFPGVSHDQYDLVPQSETGGDPSQESVSGPGPGGCLPGHRGQLPGLFPVRVRCFLRGSGAGPGSLDCQEIGIR